MADKLTPYRRWLGLAQVQPDFFQLLGVERSEHRPEAIRAAAEARLELLKSFQDEAGKQERKLLSEEIKLAYRCLSQTDKRAEYLAQSSVGGGPATPMALPIAVSLAKPTATPASQSAQPIATIPLATPVKSPALETPHDPLAAVAQLGSSEKKKNSRRSKSWLIPLLSLGLFLGGPLLVLAIIWFNSNQDRITQAAAEGKQPSVKPPLELGKAKPSSAVEAPFKGLLKEPSETERQQIGKTTPVGTENPEQSAAMEMVDQPNGDGDSVPPSGENPNSVPAAEPVMPHGGFASPEVAEVIRGVWIDLGLRNEDAARRRVVVEKGLLVGQGQTQQLAAAEEAIGLSENFWKQVVSSCRMLKTGEIRFGDETAMFVESTDQFVVLKLKGILVKAYFAYLPTSVAIELAERGKIEDIPRWRLQKSVALMLDPTTVVDSEQTIRQLLVDSAKDGHEIANLEWLLERRVEHADSQTRQPRPDAEVLAAAVKALNEKIPDKQLAQNNMAGRNVVIQQLQALIRDEKDASVRYAALERARKHAVKKGDLIICRQLLDRQASEFEIDIEQLWREAVEQMADYVQSPQQAELLCEAMIAAQGFGWPTFEAGVASEQKLSSAEDLARKYELKMTLDRIRYLTGQK